MDKKEKKEKKDKGDKKAKKDKSDKKEKKDKKVSGKSNGSTIVPPAASPTPSQPSVSRDLTNGPAAAHAPAPTPAAAADPKSDLCAGCGKTIMGDISHAMNKKWHLYCFVCTTCQVPVSDEYYESEGKPYCRRDFNKAFGASCAGCKKSLQGKKLKALEKEWHPQCFVCHKCRKPFPEMEYFDIDQQPYCEHCYDQEEERLLKPVS